MLERLEAEKAGEEKRRRQKDAKALLDSTLAMKRAAQMKQEQEELAFDRQMLEQLLAQTSADQQQQSQRKVGRVISCGRRIRVVHGLGGPMGWVGLGQTKWTNGQL